MAGRLIGVVGPSGVGKDTVMAGLAARRTGLGVVRRVITRPEDAGGEVFEGVTGGRFETLCRDEAFCLHWAAHGLRYGIPREIEGRLGAGEDLLVNLSRSVLRQAQMRFAGFVTLHLTAPRSVLAQRLAARGRESAEQIEARLARSEFALPDGLERIIDVVNAGPLDQTLEMIESRLYPVKA